MHTYAPKRDLHNSHDVWNPITGWSFSPSIFSPWHSLVMVMKEPRLDGRSIVFCFCFLFALWWFQFYSE